MTDYDAIAKLYDEIMSTPMEPPKLIVASSEAFPDLYARAEELNEVTVFDGFYHLTLRADGMTILFPIAEVEDEGER